MKGGWETRVVGTVTREVLLLKNAARIKYCNVNNKLELNVNVIMKNLASVLFFFPS
jgi:hypothetical protein